jgi:predicted nucleic acid-binding protein
MTVVIADTGPINYLLQIDASDLLPALFDTIHVPLEVATELNHPLAPAPVRAWIGTPPHWLTIARVPPPQVDFLPRLDLGERAAIALAERLRARLILMDDRAGVTAAAARNLPAVGTLGVLFRAADRGLIDLPSAIVRLKATNFRVRPEILDKLLRDRS